MNTIAIWGRRIALALILGIGLIYIERIRRRENALKWKLFRVELGRGQGLEGEERVGFGSRLGLGLGSGLGFELGVRFRLGFGLD